MLWNFVLFIFLLGCKSADHSVPGGNMGDSGHPFLIVTKDQYPALRAKSGEEPWRSMMEDALARSAAGFSLGSSNGQNAYRLQDYVGAAALAYILDEANAQTHAERVRDAILDHYARLEVRDGGDWGGVVPNMSSFFAAILALDIIYDALSPEEVRQCEKVISDQIFKIDREGSWADVRYGTHGTWDIYTGERTGPDDNYYEGIMRQITEDGVSPVTIHYAWERVGGGDSRLSKSGYMDVLEFTGVDRRYYNNERIQKFQRWLFGSSVNNSKEMAVIGDMLPTQGLNNDMLHRRVVNFDEEAAGYAAWFHEDRPAIGHILTYILPKKPLPAAQLPTSQLYTNGGAFLRERADDPEGLHLVLYNIKSQDEWHTHQEVNGLAFSGLGNRLLVNGGRLGAPTRPAPLNNTLTVNGEEHTSRLGGGLVEGFTADGLDYACGSAGPAFPGRKHERSVILVHQMDGVAAYSVLLDEVEVQSGEQIRNYLHPANESTVSVLKAGEIYEAPIDHYPTVPGTHLVFFFATPALEIAVEKVPSAVPDRYPNYPDHNRLEAIYPTDSEGRQQILSVLFPRKNDQVIPQFSRMAGSTAFGGAIEQEGGITDYAFLDEGGQKNTIGSTTFQAKAVLFREIQGMPAFYFIRQGIHFSNQGLGFESEAPVSLFFKDNQGMVTSPGTILRLAGPQVSGLRFDPPARILSVTDTVLEVELPEGTFYFN